MCVIRIKRVYEKPSPDDGIRVLVERLWPRGVSKEKAAVDRWCKEIAPSPELRKWYSHDVSKWEEFKQRYLKELDGNQLVERLSALAARGDVTLIIAARDPERSSAAVLLGLLEHREGA
jgi:uncharacterized protein YeaO (DUF488 family)